MILVRSILAPGNVKKSFHRCALLFIVLSVSACASGHRRGQADAHAGPPANVPAVSHEEGETKKEVEVVPPEPTMPAQELPPRRPGRWRKGYRVHGRVYYPLLTARGYEERGVACWYGPSFEGRVTSSGQVFDMYGISAAHKLLPMMTHVEVTNLENGKTVRLVVNDRGPFVSGRVIDLSYGAAKRLAMLDKGLARVRIRTCGEIEGRTRNDIVGEFFVHIGSFERKADALYLLSDMKAQRYKPWLLKVVRDDRDGAVLWRVELGPYGSMTLAEKANSKVVGEYPSAFVVAR